MTLEGTKEHFPLQAFLKHNEIQNIVRVKGVKDFCSAFLFFFHFDYIKPVDGDQM